MKMMTNSLALASLGLVGMALTRSVTPEQINENRGGGPLRRQAEVRNIDEEARTVEVAFSSEEPVTRWFGDEVLDHTAGAMIETRLQNGAAVLWNHNSDVQIGVVERAAVDADRRGRATLRFGRSARAEEIWADIVDGVIRHVSVGYFVRAINTEEREGEPDKVTIIKWEPYEISLVSVPADASVGVGRAAGEPPEEDGGDPSDTGTQTTRQSTQGTGTMLEQILRDAAGNLVRAKVDEQGNIVEVIEVLERAAATQALVTQGQATERTRTADLLELGEQYGAQSLAAEFIRDNGSVEDFTRRLVDHVVENSSDGNRALDDDGGTIGMTDSEVSQFSFIRAVRALVNPTDRAAQEGAAFEFEASRAAEEASGRAAQGIMVPVDVLTRALNTSTSGTLPGDTGGYLVDTTLMTSSFIQLLRNRSVLMGMATPLGGLVGNMDVPGQSGSGNVFWVGEDEDVGEGSIDNRLVSLNPKTIGVYGDLTRRMLMQSSMDVEALFRASLARDLGLGIDYAGFYGSGSVNQPRGIANYSGINAVVFAALQPTFAEIVAMETEVASDNADVDSMAYAGNSKFRGHCKSTEKFGGSSGATIWEQGGTVNGARTEITNQIADGDVFYGNFSDVMIGMWGGLDIVIDPYTKGKSGGRRIIMHQDVDINLRNVESFSLGRDAV